MNRALIAEITRLGGSPADPVWRWFLLNGPHGPSFTWGQARSKPRGYVSLEHLHEVIEGRAASDPAFRSRVKEVAFLAIRSEWPDLIRRGIQVLGVVGNASDLEVVAPLAKHTNASVASDARACMFELRQQGGTRSAPGDVTER